MSNSRQLLERFALKCSSGFAFFIGKVYMYLIITFNIQCNKEEMRSVSNLKFKRSSQKYTLEI